MTCKYCGKEIPEGYEKKHCPKCFAELEVELPYTAMEQEAKETTKKRRAK